MAEIIRVESGNLDLLKRVDPDCFDHDIVPEFAAACVASPDAVLMVAVDKGLVVGQCLAAIQRHPDKVSELFIDDLGVAETHRRRGIATRLVSAAMQVGRDRGSKVVWVGVDPENAGARAFYRSVGLTNEAAEVFERKL